MMVAQADQVHLWCDNKTTNGEVLVYLLRFQAVSADQIKSQSNYCPFFL